MEINWQIKKLGEVCDFQRGLTYSKKDEVDFSHNIVLRANNINQQTDVLDFSELKYINDKIKISDNKKVKRGSLMICTASGSKSHLGKIAFIDQEYDYAFGGFMGQITPKKEINPRYLFYIFISQAYKDLINNLSSGVNINNLKFDDLKNFEIPVPPLAEQGRIVGILDAVFGDIKKAKGNVERNLKNAKELFESYLQGVFANPGKDWEVRDFEYCIDKVIYTNKIQRNKFLKSGEFPIVSQEKDLINGYWDKERDLFKIKKPVIIFGDHTQILKYIDFYFVLGADGVKILQPKDILYPKFFYYFLKSITLKSLGYARHYRLLKERQVFFPKSMVEQKAIVAKLDGLVGETRKLEGIYRQKLADLEELKKSVLKSAFAGEL